MAKPVLVVMRDTHRLIPAKYAYADESVLERLELDAQTIRDLTELDAATNERKMAESGNTPSIGPQELLYGVPEAAVINAAFTHSGPHGGRFNSPGRGAWYAAKQMRTAQAEVAFHRLKFLRDARIAEPVGAEYQDFRADFSGEFHELEAEDLATCLEPGPIPQCYETSQALARRLLYSGSNGVLYPSVRDDGRPCIACFRPALVSHPRRGDLLALNANAATGSCAWKTVA